MDATFKLIAIARDGHAMPIDHRIEEMENGIRVTIPKEAAAGMEINLIRIESSLTTFRTGEEGNMIFPTGMGDGVVQCNFTEKADAIYRSRIACMAAAGICDTPRAVMLLCRSAEYDMRFQARVAEGVYALSPEFVLDFDQPDEDMVVDYMPMPGANFVDMAKIYRRYQLEEKGCVPLRERVKTYPKVAEAADCLELRIRMGWKPQPTPVRHQTLENEPPMLVACTVEKLHKIVDGMKAAGVKGAEICLVGWAAGGHDGRFPQHYPCDERFGTDEEFRAWIKKTKEYGYMVTCHSNSKGAYEIANNWDESLLLMKPDENGNIVPWIRSDYKNWGLQGGEPYHLCPIPAYEHYAKTDFPVIREYGFEGMHYVDELTAVEPVKCYCPDHPSSRKTTAECCRQIARLSRELFGGFQSEAQFDFMAAECDYVLYTSVRIDTKDAKSPLFDEIIPFWVIAFHGIIMSNAASATINYPIKGVKEKLKAIECGSRPLLYINSKFCGRDWMGKEDLHCETEEDIAESVAAIKAVADDYEIHKHLQYEFIENIERLPGDVRRITYSDGTVIVVDYANETYEIKK
ncbi:MAG: hypothetical protein IKV00_07530 [Clostridia bacterium]|nr:hypothetical protein [Clostridia bacterium]